MRVARLLWLFLLMLTVWSGMMAWEASSYMARPCPERGAAGYWGCVLDNPIAELELAASPAGFKARIDQGSPGQYETWNVAIARVNTCMDFLFIGLYWAVFVLFAVEGGGRLCRTLIGVISVAAILDVIENVRLLQALRAISNGAAFSFTPRGFSLAQVDFLCACRSAAGDSAGAGAGPLAAGRNAAADCRCCGYDCRTLLGTAADGELCAAAGGSADCDCASMSRCIRGTGRRS